MKNTFNLFSNFDLKTISEKYFDCRIVDKYYKESLISNNKKTRSDFTINCYNMILIIVLWVLNPDIGYLSILDKIKPLLLNFTSDVNKVIHSITASGLCRARKRFSSDILKKLWRCKVIINYYKEHGERLWKGFRVCSCDGTTFTLPKKLQTEFPLKLKSKYPKMLACVVYDLFSKIPIDVSFSNFPGDERGLLNQLLCNINKKTLLILDRGYPAYWLFYRLLKLNIGFIIRLPKYFNYRKIKKLGTNDWIVEFYLSKGRKSIFKKFLSNEEYENLQNKIQLRLIKTELKGYLPRFIITSLNDSQNYAYDEICQLYCDRWIIENYYRDLKHILKIETFHAQYLDGIYQEIYAAMILTIIMQKYIISAAQKYNIPFENISFKRVFLLLRDFIYILELNQNINSPFTELFYLLISRNSQKKRPGRSYKRTFYRKIKSKYNKWK